MAAKIYIDDMNLRDEYGIMTFCVTGLWKGYNQDSVSQASVERLCSEPFSKNAKPCNVFYEGIIVGEDAEIRLGGLFGYLYEADEVIFKDEDYYGIYAYLCPIKCEITSRNRNGSVETIFFTCTFYNKTGRNYLIQNNDA